MTKQREKLIQEKRNKNHINNVDVIFKMLGQSLLFALVFMIIIFSIERLGMMPWMNASINDFMLDTGFTEGESWLLFVSAIIFAFFLGNLTTKLIYNKGNIYDKNSY